jgi:ribose transport system ATP-binding protein
MERINSNTDAGAHGTTAVLDLSRVSKSFGAQRALIDLDLRILPNEIHALVGQNGCGKSTLVKLLAGYHQPDPGSQALVLGSEFRLGSAGAAAEAGLRFVHQDLALVDGLTVAENMYMTSESGGLLPLHSKTEQVAAGAALESLGYRIAPTALVGTLTQAEKTAVAVARAMPGSEPVPLLVLDEPTVALPGPEVERLFEALRGLVDRGTSVLFISHHLDEVFSFATHVTVLRDGRKITSELVGGLSHDSLVERIIGHVLVRGTRQPVVHETSGEPRLEVHGLSGETIGPVDFNVERGGILGVAGLTGSGREVIASLLSGRMQREGEVRVDGQLCRGGRPSEAIEAGLVCVPADRHSDAMLPGATVRENLTLGDLGPFVRHAVFSHQLERHETRRWIETLDVRPADSEMSVTDMSGGNQQKVMIGRWLRVQPSVLVVDEPTQGVDVGAKAAIHELVTETAEAGTAIVVCSSDSDELARLCSRVLVLRGGKVAVTLRGDEISAPRIEQEQLVSGQLEESQYAGFTGERS